MNSIANSQEFVNSNIPRKIVSKVEANLGHTRFILVDKYIHVRINNKCVKMRCMILTDKENSLYQYKLCLNNVEKFTDCLKQSVKKFPANTCQMRVEGAVSSLRLGPNTHDDTTMAKDEFSNKKKIIIGLDSEWVEVNDARYILSYQTSMYVAGPDGNKELVEFILFPNGHRLTLDRFLSIYTQVLRHELNIDIGPDVNNHEENVICYLVGHYIIVDITTFFNSKELLSNTDTIRRTQTTVGKPLFVTIYDKNYNYKQLWVIKVRDTMHLSPAGSSLAQLAKALNKNKLELPSGYSKDDMARFLKDEPEEFVMYACNDATIALDYVMQMYPDGDIPVTLGSEGAEIFREKIKELNDWDDKQFDYNFRGLLTIKDDNRHKKLIARPEAVMALEAANYAYYGGRNEAFMFGIHHAGEGKAWYDYDLTGAYPTAMSLLQNPDFSKISTLTGDVTNIDPFTYTFGYVEFEFPPNIMYPCLPIKDGEGRGLIFPMRGQTFASAPELYLALRLGAKLRWIQPGIQIGTTGDYHMGEALADLLKQRAQAKKLNGKGSVQEVKLKEQINSIYGKLAQGLSRKRSYSTRTDSVEDLPPSSITQPLIAATTTSIVRAIVSAAMNQLHKQGFRIASVTTDGFLSDAPFEVLNSLKLFGFKAAYEAARNELVGDPTMWEIKHVCKTLILVTTRGGFGIGRVGDNKLPSAKAGYKPEPEFLEFYKDNPTEELSRRFLKRKGKLEMQYNKLPSPKEYMRKNADGLSVLERKRIEWEFDLKRKPNNTWMETVTIDGETYKHLSFDTVPWECMEDFINARSIKKAHQELYPLKDSDKSNMLIDMIREKEAIRRAHMVIQSADKGGIYRTATISFLRDLLSGREPMPDWMQGLSYRQLAEAFNERLKSLNVVLTIDDFKNAKRRKDKGTLEDSEALEVVKDLLK